MKAQIKNLMNEIKKHEQGIEELKMKTQLEFNKIFDADENLQCALKKLNESYEFCWDEAGEISSWIRLDGLKNFDADAREFLGLYLSEFHFARIDFKNEIISSSVGCSIIIDENGDIFDQDSNKIIIKVKDYTEDDEINEDLRNELIEQWMHKNGYFPGVFKTDRYGNIFLINIKG